MFKQIKYALRLNLGQRMIALGVVTGLNLVFGVLGAANLYGNGMRITAVTLSALSLFALMITAIIADAQAVKNLYSAPAGYHTLLAPTPGWQVLLSKIVSMTFLDLTSFAIGALGVTWQAFLLADISLDDIHMQNIGTGIWWFLLKMIMGYLLLITAIFFGGALSRSVFFRWRFKSFLSVAGFIVVFYLLSLLNFSLAAVAPLTRVGPFFSITIYTGFNAGTIAYLILTLVKAAILFLATAHLIDRRINL